MQVDFHENPLNVHVSSHNPVQAVQNCGQVRCHRNDPLNHDVLDFRRLHHDGLDPKLSFLHDGLDSKPGFLHDGLD